MWYTGYYLNQYNAIPVNVYESVCCIWVDCPDCPLLIHQAFIGGRKKPAGGPKINLINL